MSFIRSTALAGAFTVAMSFAATAAPVISAQIVANPTAANMPFGLENFGSGAINGLVSNAPLVTSTGVNVSFTGNSGVYGGDVSGQTRSPFRTAGGSADTQYYLNARAGGSVILAYSAPQTAFNLLWGSVDPSPSSYNQLTFTFTGGGGSTVITGAQVVAGLVGVVAGTTNLAVQISNLTAFDTITVSATQEAFEFAPGVPVPEPASLALLGMGLLGLGAAARRRRRA
ncbi:MAG: PEP-CTERM sorting domain-containing protein [Acetobacteraceae bacterium]|jgi:hypothetical protein|nr:PEP-CTERM sorting domain-containing protein [Acetobacteraceae bacterium]